MAVSRPRSEVTTSRVHLELTLHPIEMRAQRLVAHRLVGRRDERLHIRRSASAGRGAAGSAARSPTWSVLVAPVPGRRIHRGGREQPDLVVVMKRLHAEVGHPRELADRHCRRHATGSCLLVPRRSEHVLGAVARRAGGEASMFFHRGLSSSAARCRAECSAVGGESRDMTLAWTLQLQEGQIPRPARGRPGGQLAGRQLRRASTSGWRHRCRTRSAAESRWPSVAGHVQTLARPADSPGPSARVGPLLVRHSRCTSHSCTRVAVSRASHR